MAAANASVTATVGVIGTVDTVAIVAVGRSVGIPVAPLATAVPPIVVIAGRVDRFAVQDQDHHHPWASMMSVIGTHCTMKKELGPLSDDLCSAFWLRPSLAGCSRTNVCQLRFTLKIFLCV